MTRNCLLAYALFACCPACSSTPEIEPSWPVARFGSTPIIDGVFDSGEWDDAAIVRAGAIELFRTKHDGVNLYLASRSWDTPSFPCSLP